MDKNRDFIGQSRSLFCCWKAQGIKFEQEKLACNLTFSLLPNGWMDGWMEVWMDGWMDK